MAANVRWLRIVVGALGVVVLLWGNTVSPARLFWSWALVIVLLAAIQFLVGAAPTQKSLDESSPESGDHGDTEASELGTRNDGSIITE